LVVLQLGEPIALAFGLLVELDKSNVSIKGHYERNIFEGYSYFCGSWIVYDYLCSIS